MPSPRERHDALLQARRAALTLLQRRDARFADARLAVFVLILGTGVAAYFTSLPWIALALPIVGFLVLLALHDRALRALKAAERGVRFHEAAIERLEGRWEAGSCEAKLAPPRHPYAEDLDLFGPRSIFARLSRAETAMGLRTLAGWLLTPAPDAELPERVAAAKELGDRVELREALAVAAAELHRGEASGLDDEHPLLPWTREAQRLSQPALPWLARGLPALAAGALLYGLLQDAWIPLVVVFALELLLLRVVKAPVAAVLESLEKPGRELPLFAALTAVLAEVTLEAPLGERHRKTLAEGAAPALAELAALSERIERIRNAFLVPLSIATLAPLRAALAAEQFRREHGARLPAWLDAVGALEALASLGAWAFERPQDRFAEASTDAPRFQADGLVHPLLPNAVPNDVKLCADAPLWIVSGSNMAGKSTLLRCIGVAVVLARAGVPVSASRCVLSPLALGPSLRAQDSLQDGASRFYAEVQKLAAAAEASREAPMLFLFDELLAGTNSRDRRVGGGAVLRLLRSRGAIGLCTTHDLALADDAAKLPGARSVHFTDLFEDGKLRFDHRLREGPVQGSNALHLLRAAGIPVDEPRDPASEAD